MQKNIFYPLGIKNIAFQVKEKPDMMANLADLSTRDPDGSGKPIHYEFDFNHSTRASGGSGAFATAPEYLKILESIMRDDEKLLTKETVDELFRPQLNEAGIQALVNYCKIPILYNIMGGSIPIDKRRNWGLSGTLAEDDYEGFYGANTQMWGGMPNLTWVSVPRVLLNDLS